MDHTDFHQSNMPIRLSFKKDKIAREDKIDISLFAVNLHSIVVTDAENAWLQKLNRQKGLYM